MNTDIVVEAKEIYNREMVAMPSQRRDLVVKTVKGLLDTIEELQKENEQLEANHVDMVARNAALRDRPDIPTERVKSVQALVDQITKLQAVVNLQSRILSESSSTMRGNELRRELEALNKLEDEG